MYPLVPLGQHEGLTSREVNAWKLLPCGAYITDGVDLFRVLSHAFPRVGEGSVQLEDCRTLDTCVYTLDEVDRAGMRLVGHAAVI